MNCIFAGPICWVTTTKVCPENLVPDLNLNPLDVRDALTVNHHVGVLAQRRESFFVNCWHLSPEPSAAMWQKSGKDGVAIASSYSRLKDALSSGKDRGFLGLVNRGSHLPGRSWNVLRFISTKREEFANENEVRALLWFPDECPGDTRHFDANKIPHPRPLTAPPEGWPMFKRLAVDLSSVITKIEVSPWALQETFVESARLTRQRGYTVAIHWSALTRFKDVLATEEDLVEILRARAQK